MPRGPTRVAAVAVVALTDKVALAGKQRKETGGGAPHNVEAVLPVKKKGEGTARGCGRLRHELAAQREACDTTKNERAGIYHATKLDPEQRYCVH